MQRYLGLKCHICDCHDRLSPANSWTKTIGTPDPASSKKSFTPSSVVRWDMLRLRERGVGRVSAANGREVLSGRGPRVTRRPPADGGLRRACGARKIWNARHE